MGHSAGLRAGTRYGQFIISHRGHVSERGHGDGGSLREDWKETWTDTLAAFSRDFKKKGSIALSTYLKQYKVGDIVDVVANGAVQKGMVRSKSSHMK